MTGIHAFLIFLLSLWTPGPAGAAASSAVVPAESATFDGTRFRSPEPREVRLGDWIRRRLHSQRGHWPKFIATPLGDPPPDRVCDGELRVTLINHSTLLVQMDGVNILTDPTWAPRAVPVVGAKRRRPAGLSLDELPPIDVVLVSHNHQDHMDLPTLRRLTRTFHPAIYVGLRSRAFLDREGIPGAHDLDWWQSTSVARGLTVTAVPARHHANRSAFDDDRMLWCGFVVSGPSGSVYFAGDTGWGSHFSEIGARFPNLRLAMLPIGGFKPVWYQRSQHIGPEDALAAMRELGAANMIPMHFGTFRNGEEAEGEAVSGLVDAVAASPDLADRVVILDNGQWTDVPFPSEAGRGQARGLTARMNALRIFPSTSGASASTSMPAEVRKSRASFAE